MKYSVAKLLKVKNRLANEISKTRAEISRNNSLSVKQEREVDVRSLFEKHSADTEKFLKIKTTISKANTKIQEKIYRMSELKGQLAWLNSLNTVNGEQCGVYSDNFVEYKAEIRKSEVNKLTEEIQKEISDIQDELDEFNATTRVELDEKL